MSLLAIAAHSTPSSNYVTVTWTKAENWDAAITAWLALRTRFGVPVDVDLVDGPMPDLTRRRALTRAVHAIGRMGLEIGTYYSGDAAEHHQLYPAVAASLAAAHPEAEYISSLDEESVQITHVIAWAAHTNLTLRAAHPAFCWDLYSTFVDMDAVGEPIPVAQ